MLSLVVSLDIIYFFWIVRTLGANLLTKIYLLLLKSKRLNLKKKIREIVKMFTVEKDANL